MKRNKNSKERKGLSCSEAGKLGAIASLEFRHNYRLQNIERYNQSPKLCIGCQIALSYDNKRNDFCSQSCAATYNNSKYPKRNKQQTNCTTCNKPLKVYNQKYCSLTCQAKLREEDKLQRILESNSFEGVTKTPATQKKFLLKIKGYSCEVCGNCNMQLPTFASKNRGNGRFYRRQRYAEGKSS